MSDQTRSLQLPGHFADDLTSAPMTNLDWSITRILDRKADTHAPKEGTEAILNVLGPDKPGLLAMVTDVLVQYRANIESSTGWRIRKDLHQSSITFSTPKGYIDEIMKKINEIRCDQIVIDSGQQEEAMKTYELSVTAPDDSGIFRDVTSILSRNRNGRAINIVSQIVRTYEHPEHPDLRIGHIELRLEVPLDLVPHISEIIDEIRERGREHQWHVAGREWIDNAESKGPGGSPTNRLPSSWLSRRN